MIPPSPKELWWQGVIKNREFAWATTDFKKPYEDLMILDQPIHQHLVTLYFIVKEFKLKNVLELGTQGGYSTVALGYAVKEIEGKLTSIDIIDCPDASKRMKERKLDNRWDFRVHDDLSIRWNKDIDCLFVDTNHTYDQVTSELKKFEPWVNKNGFIILHDNFVYKGVQMAINDYFEDKNYERYRWLNDCGLEVFKKVM